MHPVKRARLNRLVKYAVHQMATKQALDWGSVWGTVTRPEVLAGVGGALAGGGLGAALPRIFMKDKEKAKKWMLLSALLGAMAGASGGVGAVYGYRALFPGKPAPEPAPTPPKSEAKSEAPAPKPKSEVKPYTPEEMWSEPGEIEIAGMPEWMREQQTYPWLDTPLHGEPGEKEILNDMRRRELVQILSPESPQGRVKASTKPPEFYRHSTKLRNTSSNIVNQVLWKPETYQKKLCGTLSNRYSKNLEFGQLRQLRQLLQFRQMWRRTKGSLIRCIKR